MGGRPPSLHASDRFTSFPAPKHRVRGMPESGTTYQLEVHPQIPQRLARLTDLANNLWYSWDRPTRELFARMHRGLWNAVGSSAQSASSARAAQVPQALVVTP